MIVERDTGARQPLVSKQAEPGWPLPLVALLVREDEQDIGPLVAGAIGSSNGGDRDLRPCAAHRSYRAGRRQHRARGEPQEFALGTLQISTVHAT